MASKSTYEVGAVAKLSGVTVRTLHHYDQIGLLKPGGRTSAGYRRYGDTDLERLQCILFYRELGFDLERITQILSDEGTVGLDHLRAQHRLLSDRIARLTRMIAAVSKAMEAYEMEIHLTPAERLEVFGEFDPDAHAAEAQERWGDTDAYRESSRRAGTYTKQDWAKFKAASQAVNDRLAQAMKSGLSADTAEAMDAVEAHRLLINDWFYPCTTEMHVGLAEMYIADPRFTANYEAIAPGLAQYVHDAILANAGRAGAGR
jgi:DNA-binding transcriptional MerR regulator